MKIRITPDTVELWASVTDVDNWMQGFTTGKRWPCSVLQEQRLYASFDACGLSDYTLNGRHGINVPAEEFNAFTSDMLRNALPKDHSCYYVIVGQFEDTP
jgi:hypothetical protein